MQLVQHHELCVQEGRTEAILVQHRKDVVIGWLLDRVDQRTFGQIASLVNGDPFEVRLDEALTYDDARVRTGSLYSLMVIAGYLKAVPKGGDNYEVSVIDDAIADAYKDMEGEDSEEPGVGSHNAAYIAGRFWDVVRLDELGFPDDASDMAMSVTSALESAAKGFPPGSISGMLMCSAEG